VLQNPRRRLLPPSGVAPLGSWVRPPVSWIAGLRPIRTLFRWLTERGLPSSEPSLNTWRFNGTGPRFIPIGRRRWYRESALLEFLLSKIGDEVSSTSELKAKKHLLIEDKSAAASEARQLRLARRKLIERDNLSDDHRNGGKRCLMSFAPKLSL
jgi:hypothetical protein